MSWFIHDPDEWIWVPGVCTPHMCSTGHYERRDPDEVRRIKTERERAREDAVLAEADRIRTRRVAAQQEKR